MKKLNIYILILGSMLLFGCNDDDDDGVGHVKVFLTSAAYLGNRGGLAGADTDCTNAARNGGQPGTWTAWLSDDATNAVDRINDGGGGPYQLINGTVVADDMADLLDGTLDAPILIDESGNTVAGAFEVWTATNADGTSGAGTCDNWTSSDAGFVALIGRSDAVDDTWTNVNNIVDDCETFNRLYCFADVNSF
jgi:hypothetical protein